MRLSVCNHKIAYLSLSLFVIALVFCARALALDPRAELQQLNRQTWQTENGLPQNTIHSIVQSNDGYIWIATDEGLARFDGSRFVVFDRQNTPELKSNDIRDLFSDSHNALWISTSSGLTRFQNGDWKTFTGESGLPANQVDVTLEDQSGSLWIATTAGLGR